MLTSPSKISQVNHKYMINNSQNESFLNLKLPEGSSYDIDTNCAIYPLTRQQKGLWFDYKLNPESNTYNTHSQLHIKSELDLPRFNKAVNLVCNFIPIYRTHFIETGNGEVKQLVAPTCFKDDVVDFEDISDHSLDDDAKYELALKKADKKQKDPLNLESHDNYRMYLIKYSDKGYIFTGVQHHIAIDGVSGLQFIESVILAYNGGLEALQKRFNNVHYVESYLLEYEKLQEQIELAKKHWGERLKKSNLILDIYGRSNEFAMKQSRFSLGKDRSSLIKKFSKQNKTTPFITMSVLYAVLLYRYFGQNDISMGYPINVRPVGFKDMFGYYIAVYPLRVEIDGRQTITQLVNKITLEQKEDRQHLHLTTDQIIELMSADNKSMNRDFNIISGQSLFSSNSLPAMEGVDVEVEFGTGLEVKDLSLLFDLQTQDLDCRLTYNSNLFAESVINEFIANYRNLIDVVLNEENSCFIDEIDYINPEQKKFLSTFNNTNIDYPQDKCIHELFIEQAEKNPNKIAIVFEDQKLTYKDLNDKSTQLATHLQLIGVKPDDLIGIYTQRSPQMLIGILGILKSQAGYVPLDPTYPKDRLKYMLNDSGVKILLTESDLKEQIKETANSDIKIISLDEKIEFRDETSLEKVVKSNNLAYVIYTSGSTGQPKGVMIEHRSFINMSLDQIKQFNVSKEDNCLQFASQNFDASVYEIFMALFAGASLVIVPNNVRHDKELFAKYIKDHAVTVATLSPSFLKSHDRNSFVNLKTIITAGEAANVEDALYYSQNKTYINAYGPTESSVCCACYKVSEVDKLNKVIPIGKPISNSAIYILDRNNKIVPVGIYGELHIAGVGLARGYLNMPELTAKKFIPNPFVNVKDNKNGINQRLYKSGDLARWLPDGNIEYLGRIDTQVKVRGFRIELGEIESCLNKYPSIKESVVIAKGESENKQLIAYFIANDGLLTDEIDICNIKNYLKRQLPDYMVPSLFIAIEQMPLNSNGKIDRKLLEQKDITNNNIKKYVAPGTLEEEKLVKIFSEVLKIRNSEDFLVGIEDDFFELGGNSLLATQVISRIRSEFKVDVELGVIFENSTIAQISKLLTKKDKVEDLLQLVKIENRPKEIPLSFCQERLWFLDQLESSARYNIPMVLRIKGCLNKEILHDSFKKMVARHEVFRTSFAAKKDNAMLPCQVVSSEVKLNYEEVENSFTISKVKELISKDVHQSFDLSNGYLLRVKLFCLDRENDHVLYINMHHIISDGWSCGIFLQEISEIYDALHDGQKNPLSELSIQYVDYAIWQRQFLSSEILDRHISYWTDHLAGYGNVIDLPTDFPRPIAQSGNGNSVNKIISQDLTNRLKEYSRSQGYTMYMISLAALYILLRRYSNQSDICIGSPITSRPRKEVEDLIGFFVNTLALRINPQDNVNVRELLDLIKDITIKGYANQEAPFERVVERINPVRDLSRSPVFQVLLAYQNTPHSNSKMQLKEATIEPVDFSYDISKFDFDLSIFELNEEESASLNIIATYSTDLYKKETMERMLSHYAKILEELISDSLQKVDQIKYLTIAERQKLILDFNDTQTPYEKDLSIQDLIAEQVKRNPNNEAVIFEDQKLTYQELDKKSDELAIYLQSLEVKADDLVGICVDRSLEMVIGILAIIKSGAAYVAFDITYPTDRLGYMIEDSKIKILLSQDKVRQTLLKKIPEIKKCDINVINIDLDSKQNFQEPYLLVKENQDLVRNNKSHNLVYVIYTSGSTGRPKGVMVQHQSLCNLIIAMRKKFNFSEKSSLLALATYCFDMFELEMFLPLASGAKYFVCTREKAWDVKLLRREISKLKPTLMQATPSTWTMLFDDGWKNEEGVEILCGGEALTAKLQQLFIKTNSKAWNMYGPTEATVWCSGKIIEESDKNTLSVGSPIANNQIYILDQYNNLVPIGVYGELHIAGDGLARGYLNRKDLSEAKFISNPFATTQENKVLYKSGDLARWLADGNIEYFGRIDTQVKVRGFRIELGEIENCLNKYPSIQESTVVARGNEENKQLVAYYVIKSDQGEEVNIVDLKNYLKKELPEYMIPSAFVALDKIPLNSNGKVDRKLLSNREISIINVAKYVAPKSLIEKTLVKIFAEVLQIKDNKNLKIGIDDSFFELGGHSLLAIHLASKIKSEFNLEIRLSSLFQHPTVKELALVIEDKNYKPSNSNLIPLQAKGKLTPIFAIPGIGGSSSYFIDLANSLGGDQPCYGLNYPGYNQEDRSYKTIESLAKYYISLIKEVQKTGPYYLLGHSFGALIAFEIAYQLEQKAETVLVVNLDGRGQILEDIKLRYNNKKIKDKNLECLISLVNILKSFENIDIDSKLLGESLKPLTKEKRYEHVRQELIKVKIFSDAIPSNYLAYLVKTIDMQAKMSHDLQGKKIKNMIYFKAEKMSGSPDYKDGCGWENYVEKLVIKESSGHHFVMVKHPYVEKLINEIKKIL